MKTQRERNGALEQPMTTEVARVDNVSPLTGQYVERAKQQLDVVKTLMSKVLVKDVHYGVIPGTQKPTLLKPGAEQLRFAFRLGTRLLNLDVIDVTGMPGHREVRVQMEIYELGTGAVLGVGVGSCSTLESKYRYRQDTADFKSSGELVPHEYWNAPKDSPVRAKIAAGRRTKKIDGDWYFGTYGEKKVENPDIADTWNTVLKIAKKRAEIDATLAATAASDTFTQDVEDFTAAAHTEAPVEKPAPSENRPADSTSAPKVDRPIVERPLQMLLDALQRSQNVDAFVRGWKPKIEALHPRDRAALASSVEQRRKALGQPKGASSKEPNAVGGLKDALTLLDELHDMAKLDPVHIATRLAAWEAQHVDDLDELNSNELDTIKAQVALLKKRAGST